jgi:hypothetical protein
MPLHHLTLEMDVTQRLRRPASSGITRRTEGKGGPKQRMHCRGRSLMTTEGTDSAREAGAIRGRTSAPNVGIKAARHWPLIFAPVVAASALNELLGAPAFTTALLPRLLNRTLPNGHGHPQARESREEPEARVEPKQRIRCRGRSLMTTEGTNSTGKAGAI